MKKFEAPEIIDKTADEIDEIIAAVNKTDLPEATKLFLIKCIRLACWLPSLLQKKNISLSRLRKMIFGKGYGLKKLKKGTDDDSSGSSSGNDTTNSDNGSNNDINSGTDDQAKSQSNAKSNSKNKGRNGHAVYQDYEKEWVTPDGFTVGDKCPQLCGGRLYALPAGVVVRITGQNFAKPTKYYLEKLRCNVCYYYISAKLPSSLGNDKYTPSFKAQLALLKFYLGVPYYRLEQYQKLMGCPLPDSTQWGIIEELAGHCYKVFHCLQRLAANGPLMYNDDTWLRILEVIAALKQADDPKRTGMYTTCVMGEHEGHKIALYLNGTLHSGENVDNLLKKRGKEKPLILQMSDALAANTPKNIETLACNCLSHGFQKFEELKDYFPNECLSVMRKLSAVFKLDAKTKKMSDDARLAYHQKHSQPIMFKLYKEIKALLASSHVEPNGDLAAALNYLKNHWVKLTRFLTVPGAPIANNIVERALKLAIRARKNSLFYKSTYSASISGMLTSLIYTCQLANINPVDYLTILQTHKEMIQTEPERWLPWNYQLTMEKLKSSEEDAKVMVTPPASDSLVATSLVTSTQGL